MCHASSTELFQTLAEYSLVFLRLGLLAIGVLSVIPLVSPGFQDAANNAAAAVSVGAQADQSLSHGWIHGADATNADNCFERHGAAQIWFNPTTGRTANVCFEGNNFFIQILDRAGYEVTRFKRNSARSLGDIGKYLKNNGYTH